MNIKKISVVMLLMSALNMPVHAEQPAAEEYRQMFQSGTYYLEYSIRDYDEIRRGYSRDEKKLNPGVDDDREEMGLLITAKGSSVGFLGSSSMLPIGTGVTYAVANEGNYRIQSFKKIVKNHGFSFWGIEIGSSQKANIIPRLMYRDGKYYRFSAGMGMAGVTMLDGDLKDNQAIVLSENDMNSPELDLGEGWATIRAEMAIPIEFTIFDYKDPFVDNINTVEIPTYKESMECSIGKNTYECDKYIAKEQTGTTESLSEVAYYAMYTEGKLALIQKYRMSGGEEEIMEEIFVRDISPELPDGSFKFNRPIPVFAAGMGDVNDFLGIPVQVGTLGGN
ncbi:hypothetical protein [Anaerovibrio sp.]|uniref:hypothetical protein n=1 Tax=Anaerovibrio sp. TaxID=1872532 RepID=UPI00388F4333